MFFSSSLSTFSYLYIMASRHSIILDSGFLFESSIFSLVFKSVERLTGIRLEATHVLLQSDNPVRVKCLFLTLSAVIQPGLKVNSSTCKEFLTLTQGCKFDSRWSHLEDYLLSSIGVLQFFLMGKWNRLPAKSRQKVLRTRLISGKRQ